MHQRQSLFAAFQHLNCRKLHLNSPTLLSGVSFFKVCSVAEFFVANDSTELLSLRGEEFVLFGKIWTFWQELTRRNGTRLGKMTTFVLPGEEQLWFLPR